jgi:sugar lactone lactonase YvrE
LYLLNLSAAAQSNYAAAYTFTTFAGVASTGKADGVGTAAQFNYPDGIAADTNGNLYVADTLNHTIRRISSGGVVSTIAGFAGNPGSADGTGRNARFYNPSGVALDNAGNLYVADTGNSTIRKVIQTGTNLTVVTIAGLARCPGTNDGPGNVARFNQPTRLVVDAAGDIYVGDTANFTIRKIITGVVSTIAGVPGQRGTSDGVGDVAKFNAPEGLAVDSAGNLYVADSNNHTVRQVSLIGSDWVVSTIAGTPLIPGAADGPGGVAQFYRPKGIACDSSGNLYVSDYVNSLIRVIWPAGTNWTVSTLAGQLGVYGNAEGSATNAVFDGSRGITVDTRGMIYVADQFTSCIRSITSAGMVNNLAGAAHSAGNVNGTGSEARFYIPYGTAVDSYGDVYVADSGNAAIRKISAAGLVTTLAGTLAGSKAIVGTNDGVGNDARFNFPQGLAVDGVGTIYVADTSNHTIRAVSPAGVVTTIAGSPLNSGTNDGPGSLARFDHPKTVALDAYGNIFVTDTYNRTIRKLALAGTNWTVSTIAGSPGLAGSDDGPGNTARFAYPLGIVADNSGNVYVSEYYAYTIRKLTPSGTNWIVSTIAGLAGSQGTKDGTNNAARFYNPYGLAIDSLGALYVAEGSGGLVRKLNPAGTSWVVTTIGGVAATQGSADGAGSAALFTFPAQIAVDSAGTLYFADTGNCTIRKGVFTAYTGANAVVYAQPPMSAQLVVTVLPPEAGGQWRFPWELGWHSSGQTASNLVAGNYPVEFRDVPGYLAFPPVVTAALSSGATTEITNQYYPTFDPSGTTNTGALAVNIGPSAPSGAGWRSLGETTWRAPGSTAGNLLPDTYFIEFAPVSGYSKPASQAVQVSAGTTTAVWASYLLAQSAPSEVCLPVPVPADSISDLTNYPYGFNGQLQSDVGYGSGVAVQTNVVLTAAHLVFDDQTLSYVSQVYWRFRQEAGVFSPQPQAARGWYVLSGYAVQRTNDVLGGLGPGRSSPQSRNLDVAALYFEEPVAGGGHGGYLPADTVPNSWLTSTSQKMLVGYPVDGSSLGDASIVPGVMYQVGPQPYPLSLATDPVASQQEYLAHWFLSYPGNSGGPFYVQYNGYYYPAGVCLGTLYNGVVPYASLVRGIDSNVVNLITQAAILGDSGTNYTGGGVITIRVGAGSGQYAYLQVNIGPHAALDAGGAWRVQGTTAWSGGTTYTAAIAAGESVTLEFKPIAGWNAPVNNTVQIALGQMTVVPATYTANPALLAVSPTSGLTASGFAGGAFSPSSATYTLTNSGGASLNWSASKTAAWLSLSASSGMLAAGARTNVTVSFNANASNLGPGNYSGTLGFTNLSNGLGNTTRSVSLTVSVHPPVVLANPKLLTNGGLAMTLEGVTNRVYSIVVSTNLLAPLTNWAEFLRLTNTAGQTRFTNPPSFASPQFYRAREL